MKNKFWSDDPYDWGIIPLSCYIPNIKSFYERESMTDEQERKIYKMDDQKLLIELAIAYGSTIDVDLGDYHRRNLMAIFADLNLDHMVDFPCDADTKLLLHCDGRSDGEKETFCRYRCPSCNKDLENLHNARHDMVQCPCCKHVDDLSCFAKEGSDTWHGRSL